MQFLKNLKIKDKISISIVLVVLVFVFIQKIFFSNTEVVDNRELTEMMIGDIKVMVEIAETEEEKYKGLSYRESLDGDEGVLFLYKHVGVYEYVMRDMRFDLDFIFIRDEEVVDIAKNVSKDYKGIIKGAINYNKVLEVNAGWTDKNGIQLGNKISSL